MSHFRNPSFAFVAAAMLAGCATVPGPGPVQITRFHDAAALAQLGQGTFFVETAPGENNESLEIAAYKAAVASRLAALGYRETAREEASQIAQVRLGRHLIAPESGKRGPVSVGVGGSTGSYGSGVGLGIGINLGGGKNRERVGTDLGVMIRDKASGNTIWEGRASLEVSKGSPLEATTANAAAITQALFSEFPGNNGESLEVKVSE
ncbi:MAG: hypothetical protein A3J40_11620 [Erythrobacter sp. RIFCSPHIGHO2_12_FULL_63_10]|nr:MAG: hypothetical protein A3J40_11620 [Erythrobacter sp. RIFCSPHIGHO2_12_FULL_63_10]